MSLVRTIFAVLLVLTWFPSSNACLLASAIPGEKSGCCEHEEEKQEGGCDESGTCAKCAPLENGCRLASLEPYVAPVPWFTESEWLTELLRKRTEEIPKELSMAMGNSPPPPQQALWNYVARTALPVRGPSLLA